MSKARAEKLNIGRHIEKTILGLDRITFGILAALGLIRVWVGQKAGIWYNPGTPHDDAMLVSLSILPQHFVSWANERFALAKTMVYPLFLDFVHFSGLPYTLIVSFLWLAAGILAVILVRKIVGPAGWVTVLIFAFVLFSPVAFDIIIGAHLYRNAIIMPFALLLFFAMILILIAISGKRKPLAASILLGLLFAVNYYITENGVWLLPALGVFTVTGLVLVFRKRKIEAKKTMVLLTAVCILPSVLFIGAGQAYKAVNYHYFGVYETNTRTEGPAGGYAARVYRIASENRTGQIWAPTDAIEKTFEVSETLKSAPEFRKHLIDENQWSGNLHDTPIRGDFLTWMIPDAFADAGMWETHQKFNDFFEAVNRELDEAFADGRLQEDDRIQIVGMSGGRTPAEIRALWPLALNGFENAIFYYDYAYPTNSGRLDMFDNEMQIYASGVKANYITNMYLDAGSFIGYFTGERRGMELFTMNLIRVYQATGIPIFLLSLVGLVLCLIRIFHKQKRTKSLVIQAVFMLTMLATTIAVIVGISWFVDFMGPPGGPFGAMKFYAVGAVPCVVVFEVLGLSNFYAACTARRSRKINETE